jgi:hypothetical protein
MKRFMAMLLCFGTTLVLVGCQPERGTVTDPALDPLPSGEPTAPVTTEPREARRPMLDDTPIVEPADRPAIDTTAPDRARTTDTTTDTTTTDTIEPGDGVGGAERQITPDVTEEPATDLP